MPADEFTAAHFKAIKACIEVADPVDTDDQNPLSPAATVKLAEEGMNILLQHNPGLDHTDPLDQLSDTDRHLLVSYTDASNRFYWQQDQGSDDNRIEQAGKIYHEWQQAIIERLTR